MAEKGKEELDENWSEAQGPGEVGLYLYIRVFMGGRDWRIFE